MSPGIFGSRPIYSLTKAHYKCRFVEGVPRRLVDRSVGYSLGRSTVLSLSLSLALFYSRIQLMIVVSEFCGFFVLPSLEQFPIPTSVGLSAAALGANFGNNLAFIASSWLHVAFALCDVQLAPRGTSPFAGVASIACMALSTENSRLSHRRAEADRTDGKDRNIASAALPLCSESNILPTSCSPDYSMPHTALGTFSIRFLSLHKFDDATATWNNLVSLALLQEFVKDSKLS